MKNRRYSTSARSRKRVVTRSKFRFERRKNATRFTLYLAVVAMLGTGAWWTYKAVTNFLYTSEHFRISRIEVKGLKNMAQAEITPLLAFKQGDNMFRADLSAAEKAIEKYKPELKKASVSRGWQKIVVRLEERSPVASVALDGQLFGVDQDNKPFPLRGSWTKAPLPEIKCQAEPDRRKVLDFVREFAPKAGEIFPQVLRFYLEPMNRIVFDFKDGSRILWGPAETAKLGAKLARLTQVLEESKARFASFEYVNMSFFDDGRIIVKPKGKF
jgi:cell division septal protein FtsQ